MGSESNQMNGAWKNPCAFYFRCCIIFKKEAFMKKSKAIIKSAKKWMPYDYGYTMDLMSTALSEMLRYYEEGNGVMQADESAEHIRETLREAINKWNAAEAYEASEYERFEESLLNNSMATLKDLKDFWDGEEVIEQKKYDEFFLYVSKHFREWWD